MRATDRGLGNASNVSCQAGATAWVRPGARYTRDKVFGRRSDEWIAAAGGLSFHDGRLFLFDGGDPRVLVLDATDLFLVREFGREGQGPGEFEESRLFFPPRYWDFGFIDATDAGIGVYDREAVEVFDEAGSLITRFGDLRGGMLFGVKFVSLVDAEHLLVAWDDFDRADTGRRRLVTYLVSGGDRSEIVAIPLTPPPTPGRGSVTIPARQSRPLWVHAGRCIFMSDGASPYLFQYDLDSGNLDTIPLPAWDLPGESAEEQERRGAVERAISRRAGSGFIASLPGPTELMRWSDLAVDPSGRVWIERWRADPSEPSEVVVVEPGAGRYELLEVPTFPKAFAPDGVFFGLELIPETDQTIVTRYRVVGGEDE